MATKTATNVAAVLVRGSLGFQLVETGLYYLFDAAIGDSDLASLLATVSTQVISEWLPQLNEAWVGREVYGYDMTAGSTLQHTDTTISGEMGSNGTAAQANNVTLAIARKTGHRGRSTQGRIYWPGISDAMMDGVTQILSSAAANIVAAITATDAAVASAGWTPVTVSFQHDGVVSSAGVVTPISAWEVTDLRVDSQRRRLAGRGV